MQQSGWQVHAMRMTSILDIAILLSQYELNVSGPAAALIHLSHNFSEECPAASERALQSH